MPLDTSAVNIRVLEPPIDKTIVAKQTISLGDLHSNPMKFLHFLALYGVIEINQSTFDKLWQTYDAICPDIKTMKEADETIILINEFSKLIEPLIVNKPGLLILIGDELADRGKNDLLILVLLKKLHEEKVPYWIQLSNHGLQALAYFEHNMLPPFNKAGQLNSLEQLDKLKMFIPNFEKVLMDEYVKAPYLKHLSLIGYQKQEQVGLILYSHAPIDFTILMGLASEFDVRLTPGNMIKMIDDINLKAFEAIQTGTFIEKHVKQLGLGYESSALNALIWNRKVVDFPHHSFPSVTINVHGHVGLNYPKKVGYVNIDNDLGKPDENMYDKQGLLIDIIPADEEGESLVFREALTSFDYSCQYYKNAVSTYLQPAISLSSASSSSVVTSGMNAAEDFLFFAQQTHTELSERQNKKRILDSGDHEQNSSDAKRICKNEDRDDNDLDLAQNKPPG